MKKTYLIASFLKRGCVISFVLEDPKRGEYYDLRPLEPFVSELVLPVLFTRDESIKYIKAEIKEKGHNVFELYPIPFDVENLKKFYESCWN